MGIICLYVLIQKSGQKTAKSHLCAVWCSWWIPKCNFMLISKSIVLTYPRTYQTISHQLEISNKYRHQFSGLIKNLNPREHKFPQNVKTEIQRSFVFFKMLQKISKSWDPRWTEITYYYLNILLFVVPKG